MATFHGSPEYSAPEMVAVEYAGSSKQYNAKVDVWSIGVVTYFCLSGNHPFWQYEDNLPAMLNVSYQSSEIPPLFATEFVGLRF